MNFESDFKTDAPYNVRALYRKTWLNSFGGEWLTALQIGTNQSFLTEFYQPVEVRQRFFVRPAFSTASRKAPIYFDGDQLAEYRVRETRPGCTRGANLGVYGQVFAGWTEKRLSTTRQVGSTVFPDTKGSVGGIAAAVALDTQDFAFFPTKGYKANVSYFAAERTGDGLEKYGYVEGRLSSAVTFGDLILLGGIAGGQTTDGLLPFGEVFALGGLGRLSAYAPGQIVGRRPTAWATAGAVPADEAHADPRVLPPRGRDVRGGLHEESGHGARPHGRIDSFGVYLASNTLLGPMYLGYSRSRRGTAHLSLHRHSVSAGFDGTQ